MNYNLLAAAFHHPNSQQPYRGIFNRRTLKSLSSKEICSLSVVSPTPYAPPIGPGSVYRDINNEEKFEEYLVSKPRFVYAVPKNVFYLISGWSYRRCLEPFINKTSADILHGCHIYPDGFGLVKYGREMNVPVTFTCHGHFLNQYSDLPIGLSKAIKKTLNRASHVFCVSEALAEKARKISGHSQISTVPIGAEPSNFPTSREAHIRHEFNINSESTVVLFCGQFIQRKGVQDIIRSINKFPDQGVEYIFVGHGGNLKQSLENAIRTSGMSDMCRVLSGVTTENLRKWYSIADLLMLPSYSEGRPTVIYEAMASETAVLSTNIEGVSEQVVDGETGILIQPGDTQALVDSLNRLAHSKDLLSRMGNNAQSRLISKRWTWSDHADRIVKQHRLLL